MIWRLNMLWRHTCDSSSFLSFPPQASSMLVVSLSSLNQVIAVRLAMVWARFFMSRCPSKLNTCDKQKKKTRNSIPLTCGVDRHCLAYCDSHGRNAPDPHTHSTCHPGWKVSPGTSRNLLHAPYHDLSSSGGWTSPLGLCVRWFPCE